MLTLKTFPSSSNEPSHSPYCTKAMILLQMSGQTWQRKDISNPSNMPYGKLPVLQVNDVLIPDSELIRDWLIGQGAQLYPNCSPADIATGQAMMRMFEESLRRILVYDRWLDDRCWAKVWPLFFADVPTPMRKLIANSAQKNVRRELIGNGIGRLSSQDRLRKAENDLATLENFLGTKDFLLGKNPTAADAAVLPVLSLIDRLPVKTELTQLLQRKDGLMQYLARARLRLYTGIPR